MKKGKMLWLFCMIALCLALYVLVDARMDSTTNVIFGGVEGAYVKSDSVSFIDPNATEQPEPTADIWPDIDITLTQYTMVNNDNKLSSAYEPDVSSCSKKSSVMFETSALPYLEDMLQAMEDAGLTYYLAGGYRSYSFQSQLFNSKATQFALELGLPTDFNEPDYQIAVEKAKTVTAYPGASEHQLGLAVDIYDKGRSKVYYDEMNKDIFNWLDEHAADYGFIRRYPTKKLLLTGWDEPWHYRYVGAEAAKFIKEQDLCYEEFYAHYDSNFTY